MKLLSLIATVVASSASLSLAAAPKVVKTESYRIPLEIEKGPSMEAFYVVNTFDQPIFYKNPTSGISVPASSLLGTSSGGGGKGGDQRMPNAVVYGYGSAVLNCNGQSYPPWSGNEPIYETIVLPATSAPISSFLMSMSGFALNETVNANQHVAMTIVMDKSKTNEQLAASCKVKYLDASNFDSQVPTGDKTKAFFVSDDQGAIVTSFDATIPVPKGDVPCTFSGMKETLNMFSQIVDIAKDVKRMDDFGAIQFFMSGLTARPAIASCKKLAMSFFQTTEQSVMVAANKHYCPYQYESAEWFFDPCCNWNLGQYQCCVPKQQEIKVPVINAVKTAEISGKCKNAGKVVPLVYDFSDVMNKAGLQADVDVGSMWQTYTQFQQNCQKKVFEQDCTADSQCYSGKCDTQHSQRCVVNWGEEYIPLVACYLDLMTSELSFELKNIWGLPAVYPNASVEQDVFAQEFETRLFNLDCVGPNAWQYRSRMEWKQNDQGYYEPFNIPGNQTGCVAEQRCNFQPWQNDNAEKCTAGKPAFCAQCMGNWCNSVTQYPTCAAWSLSNQQDCEAEGGKLSPWNSCQFDVDNIDQCYNSTFCAGNSSEYNQCSWDQCAKLNVTDPNDCSWETLGVWGQYDADKKICKIWVDRATCQSKNFTYYTGRWYQEGRYNTKEKCDAGMCDVPYLYGQEVSKSKCESTQFCTKPCPECQGGQACISKSVATQSDCSNMGGSWNNNECNLYSIKDADECSKANGTFYSCGDLSNKTTCSAGSPHIGGSCYWSEWGNCKSKEACESRGECEDWEFFSQCEYQQEGSCEIGVCFKPTPKGNQTYCDHSNNENWSRNGCILAQVVTSDACASNGGIWKKRAKSKAECDAHGMGCDEEDSWGRTPKNATECAKCNGQSKPLHRWNGGVWKNGTVIPLDFKTKQMEQVNQWKNTLDYNKLNEAISTGVSGIAIRSYLNSLNKKYTTIFTFLSTMACSCGDDSRSDCFDVASVSSLAECRADPGVASDCEGVLVSNDTFGTNSSATVKVDLVSGASFVSSDAPETRASLAEAKAFAVIKQNGFVVGQLVGNGKAVTTSSEALKAFKVCLDVNPSIPQANGDFPTADIAQLKNGVLQYPMKSVAEIQGTLLCADVEKSGTYFPILRVTDPDAIAGEPKDNVDPGTGGGTSVGSGSTSAVGGKTTAQDVKTTAQDVKTTTGSTKPTVLAHASRFGPESGLVIFLMVISAFLFTTL